jgi:hypothetical protein
MQRTYPYRGYAIRIAVHATVDNLTTGLGSPCLRFVANVKITLQGADVPILSEMEIRERDGQSLPNEAEALLASGTAGQRIIDDLIRTRRKPDVLNIPPLPVVP